MPTRKDIRLKNYDYSQNGAYFVTVCTKNKMCIFWENNDKYQPFTAENGDENNQHNVDTTNESDVLYPNVGTAIGRPQTKQKIHLSEYGKYVKEALNSVNQHYPMVYVDKYVIMPNHIHVIIRIDNSKYIDIGGRPMAVPTISTVINQLKGYVSKKSGFHVWQGRFHDRILRNEHEYYGAWQYIESNPTNWENDELFINEN